MNALIAGYRGIIIKNEWFINEFGGLKQYKHMIDSLIRQNEELKRKIEALLLIDESLDCARV